MIYLLNLTLGRLRELQSPFGWIDRRISLANNVGSPVFIWSIASTAPISFEYEECQQTSDQIRIYFLRYSVVAKYPMLVIQSEYFQALFGSYLIEDCCRILGERFCFENQPDSDGPYRSVRVTCRPLVIVEKPLWNSAKIFNSVSKSADSFSLLVLQRAWTKKRRIKCDHTRLGRYCAV